MTQTTRTRKRKQTAFQSTDVVQGSEESTEIHSSDRHGLGCVSHAQSTSNCSSPLPLEGSDYFHGAEVRVPLNTRDGLKAYDTTAIVLWWL